MGYTERHFFPSTGSPTLFSLFLFRSLEVYDLGFVPHPVTLKSYGGPPECMPDSISRAFVCGHARALKGIRAGISSEQSRGLSPHPLVLPAQILRLYISAIPNIIN